ncbi:Protein CBG19998 [Caenorhabditis briggsae]|uniref:Protein CBG19998 n=1 Tax=Caenorhabditis briggsae TaxID=6238 RepID=A8XWW5_CAEBR|nr:Protein CBG19998 [Caenorhabditis briggsae]CAP37134.2 Protein CBG19998 [Caenorhabditis briggsae]
MFWRGFCIFMTHLSPPQSFNNMSVTSFLRRFSIDVENTGGSSSSSAPGSASSSGPTKRRGRIAASIDSARRRFSLQHGSGTCRDQDPVHLQSIALRGRGKGENGSLPDLMENLTFEQHI